MLNLLGVFINCKKSFDGTNLIPDMFYLYITKLIHLMYVFRRVILEKPSKQLHTKHSRLNNWSMVCPGGAKHSPKLQISLDGMREITGVMLN
ncbi:hypothetical protein VIGAN_09041700 [Vigna angularis var. angularis]|uniref:Uncharacterized protein n=1 Tax=Vigna angularis var. angularis TaxID=157739 RepID=A0A0S3SWT7_PHAAN|nr:hypothetical protein VIGAN_09041700 [Vigna angularis var. angularis]